MARSTSPGAVGVGTRYRELVRMPPALRGEIRSTVTRYESDRALEEDFEGAGTSGHLAYGLAEVDGGTCLEQRQTLELAWRLRPLTPLVRRTFGRRLRGRLDGIAELLEGRAAD